MQTIPDLPPALAHEIYAELCASLPPPFIDTADAIASRINVAAEFIANLRPVNALEARLALDVVLAEVYAADTFRLVTQHRDDFAKSARCRDQAGSLLRQAQRIRRTLMDMHAERQKAAASAFPAPRPIAPAAPEPQAAAQPAGVPTQPDPPPDALAAADEYALEHVDIAAEIRAAGGLTPKVAAGIPDAWLPRDPAMIHALVHGDTPILRKIDELIAEDALAA